VLLGHSLGGRVALYVALKRLDLVSKLILEDIIPIEYKERQTS
jgi:pimeloyl-ACP methyl ester carboxylesterase